MRRSILSILLICLLTGCNLNNNKSNSSNSEYDEINSVTIKDKLNSSYKEIFDFRLIVGDDICSFDSYEFNDLKDVLLYKYRVVDENKYIFSTVYNRYSWDDENTIYDIDAHIEGTFESKTYQCKYVGEAGFITCESSYRYYEDDNYLQINFNSNINKTMSNEDYELYKKQNSTPYSDIDGDVSTIFNHPDWTHTSFKSFSYYIDLNNYTDIFYSTIEYGDLIRKEITQVERKGIISSDYFYTYKQRNTNFELGGKYNSLNLSEYSNDNDRKYIPYQDELNLPTNLIVNEKDYQQENSYCGEVLLEVDTYYNYDEKIVIYEELNYKNRSVDENKFNEFKKQERITYTVDTITHVIDSKNKMRFTEKVAEENNLVFVYVNN